jgi:hypothetical protein
MQGAVKAPRCAFVSLWRLITYVYPLLRKYSEEDASSLIAIRKEEFHKIGHKIEGNLRANDTNCSR